MSLNRDAQSNQEVALMTTPKRDPLQGGGSFPVEVIGLDEWQGIECGDAADDQLAALDLDAIVVVEAPYAPEKIRALFEQE